MLFNYQITTKEGQPQSGSVDAPNIDMAIAALQRRDFIVVKIEPAIKKGFLASMGLFQSVKSRELVILSRQLATLVEAKVSLVSAFRLVASESGNPLLSEILINVTDDIKSGVSVGDALAKHPNAFSDFYVSMIRSGEESGKLSDVFNYLADYLERSYELVSKAKNALVYPAFVIVTFIAVMILMLVLVIPKLTVILEESGQEIPFYTKMVIGISDFFVNYGIIMAVVLLVAGVFGWNYTKTPAGKLSFDRSKISVPYIGSLYRKLYLSRMADNLNTMLTSGVSVVRAIEITASVVDNEVYKNILTDVGEAVKSGQSMSDIFSRYPEVPSVMSQMVKVGEETGRMGFVLNTLARFYRREVDNEVDTIVGLIEPIMIVLLGVGVGMLLTSVLVPIYNLASAI